MAYTHDYTFENMSRIGNDNCYINQRQIQDTQYCNYLLQNYFVNDCTMKNPISLATSQPCVNYTGGMGSGAGGCNIDTSSSLQIGSINTNNKCRISLFQRPFSTVPFLGRGSVCPIMESEIMQGEMGTNKRSITNMTEKSYLKYSNTPLIPEMQQKFGNASYCVEGAASEGWIRGGIPSRELTKDSGIPANSNYNYAS